MSGKNATVRASAGGRLAKLVKRSFSSMLSSAQVAQEHELIRFIMINMCMICREYEPDRVIGSGDALRCA